jgi:hypothetical protein
MDNINTNDNNQHEPIFPCLISSYDGNADRCYHQIVTPQHVKKYMDANECSLREASWSLHLQALIGLVQTFNGIYKDKLKVVQVIDTTRETDIIETPATLG